MNQSQPTPPRRPADLEALERRVLFATGDLDPGFGTGGLVLTDFGPVPSIAADMTTLPDGGVLLVGDQASDAWAVMKLNAAGRPDAAFGGGDGRVFTEFPNGLGDQAGAVAALPDGRFYVAGAVGVGFEGDQVLAVARYLPDGRLDPTFSPGSADGAGAGIARLNALRPGGGIGDGFDFLLPQPDGKVLVAGSSQTSPVSITLARLLPDGSPDTGFGAGGTGVVTTDLRAKFPFGTFGTGRALALLPDGDIVLLAETNARNNGGESPPAFALLRYNPDGALDPAFGGGDGVILSRAQVEPRDLAVVAGRILVAGSYFGDAAVLRYTADGAPDASFGFGRQTPSGERLALVDFGATSYAAEIAPAAGHQFFLAGGVPGDGRFDFALAKLNPDGTPDTSFGPNGGGRVMTDFGGIEDGQHMAVGPDGRITIAGTTRVLGSDDFDVAVARYFAVEPLPPGEAIYEAERAALSGGARFSNVFPEYSGSGFVDFVNPAGESATFTVQVAEAGAYQLRFRFANGSAAPRAMDLRVNGVAVPGGVSFGPTGSWDGWAGVAVTVDLPAGTSQARLTSTGQSGPNLDAMVVKAADPLPPAGDIFLHAEGATARTGARNSNAFPGFTGSGFVDFINPSGDFVEYSFHVGNGGAYELEFRYANGGTTARTMGLTVNGRPVTGGVRFAPTGSWSNWATVKVPATLPNGRNVIRLTATGQSGPNLDSIRARRTETVPNVPATYQTETAARFGVVGGIHVSTAVPGYTGSGFVDYVAAAGEYVEFTVGAAADGEYDLEFRYGNGSPAARGLELRVNNALHGVVAFNPTGAWSDWRIRTVRVRLTEGPNTIRLASTGQSGPNLDALTVRPVVSAVVAPVA